MEQFTNTGYVRKTPDPRNHILEAQQAPLEASAIPPIYKTDITPFKLPENVFMQHQEPSCIAHGVVWAIMYYHWKNTGQFVKLSPRFLYAMCKTVDGLPNDAGTYLETALNLAKNIGVCEDSFFTNDCTLPLDTYCDASLIPQAAKDNALKYKIDSYAFLSNLTVQGVQNALYQNGIVIIATEIGNTWWTSPSGVSSWAEDDLLPLRPFDATHPEVSGHCVDLYAYGEPWDATHPTNLYGMNWWSLEWAAQGRFCYGANYEPTIYEAAVIRMAGTAPAPASPVEVETDETFLEHIEEDVDRVVETMESVL